MMAVEMIITAKLNATATIAMRTIRPVKVFLVLKDTRLAMNNGRFMRAKIFELGIAKAIFKAKRING
jgi:hypothetical protein